MVTTASAATGPAGEAAPPDPRDRLAAAPMSRFQWLAVTLVGLLYMLDGFDVMAIAFAAPALRIEWQISKAELGYALSAGLLGMAAGSLLLSPLADVAGRRRVLLAALAVTIAGTAWTAGAPGLPALLASRLVTGLGIGAMLGVVSPLAAEYANARRRDLAVSLTSVGYGVGAILGGLLSSVLLSSHGWRSIFYAATGFGVVMAVLAAVWLPEPIELVIQRPGRTGLARANAYLARCGQPPVAALPPPARAPGLPIVLLLAPGWIRQTATLTLLYFLYTIPLFYMQTWTPALVAEMGLPPAQAPLVAAAMSVGGVAAGGVVAVAARRVGLKRMQAVLLGGAAIAMALFVLIPGRLPLLLAGAAVVGLFLMGSMVGIWAIIARVFPARLRASGTGVVLGIGRLGSALPPVLAGLLFTAGFGRVGVTLLLALPLLACLLLLALLRLDGAEGG